MTSIVSRIAAALTVAIVCGGAVAAESESTGDKIKFSAAETALWMTDQLKAIKAPSVLTYNFVKSGSFEDGFSDRVIFTVDKVNAGGMKSATLDFFSGERHFPLAPETSTNANPVLKVYMQGDVYEMNRLTDPDGKARERWRYFQRRIKFALAEDAQVEPTEFDFEGKHYRGKAVRFQPYAKDEKRGAFEKFADKMYVITLADDLPGYLFKIETIVADKNTPNLPLLHEVMQLASIKPYTVPSSPPKH